MGINKFLSGILVIGIAGCTHFQPTPTKDVSDFGKPSLGLQFADKVEEIPSLAKTEFRWGLKILTVFPFFPAEKAGLESGDELIALNGQSLQGLKTSDVVEKIQNSNIGEKLNFKILRWKIQGESQLQGQPLKKLGPGEWPALSDIRNLDVSQTELLARWSFQSEIIDILISVEAKKWSYGDREFQARPFSFPSIQGSEFHKFIDAALARQLNSEKNYSDSQDLMKRLSSLSDFVDRRRLPLVTQLFREPWSLLDLKLALVEAFRECQKGPGSGLSCSNSFIELSGLPIGSGELMSDLQSSTSGSFFGKQNYDTIRRDVKKISRPQRSSLMQLRSPADFLQKVVRAQSESQKKIESALQNLSQAEREYLKSHWQDLPQKLSEGIYIHEDGREDRKLRDEKLAQIIQKVRLPEILQSLLPLANVFSFQNIQQLQKMAKENRQDKNSIVAELKVDNRYYLIAGAIDNDYNQYKDKDIAFVLDLGGNDFYPDVSGDILDLSGNDRYESSRSWEFSAAVLSAKWVEDFAGNDIYICSEGCLGASFAGASFFHDHRGHDIYRSHRWSQAASFSGFSFFIDAEGNDSYEINMMGQGFAVAGGLAFQVDQAGNDRFYCKGSNASSYGDKGEFDGWCQGMGLGIRQFASGGWGLLLADGGDDSFEAGTFSQGGGYFFGLGSLIKLGQGNDLYRGSRYTQGFSAHQAIGIFYDEEGDDRYESPSFVGQGMAWDLSLTYFEDGKGNDIYKTCEHCLGVGSQNSLAIFRDLEGSDSYLGRHLPYQEKRYNDYHGGQSLGIFLDEGSAVDKYEKFQNGQSLLAPGWQLLIDGK